MLTLELLHVHEAPADPDGKGPISDGCHDEARADQVLRVVETDDRDAELVLLDVGLQEFVDCVGVHYRLIGEGLREARVVLEVGT